MKKQRVFSLLLICLLAFGLLFALWSCTDDTSNSSGGGGTSTSLSGRYYLDFYTYITFRTNGTFIASDYDSDITGTYTISGSTLRLSEYFYGRYWTILDSTTLRDEGGGYWEK